MPGRPVEVIPSTWKREPYNPIPPGFPLVGKGQNRRNRKPVLCCFTKNGASPDFPIIGVSCSGTKPVLPEGFVMSPSPLKEK